MFFRLSIAFFKKNLFSSFLLKFVDKYFGLCYNKCDSFLGNNLINEISKTERKHKVMKVLLVNGSPHEKGTTFGALTEVEKILQENGIETELFWTGNKPISGCMGCGACFKTGKCVIDDCVNICLEKAKLADGFIFGSPVHYAAASGSITSFMDRLFYGKNAVFCGKPAAAVVCARRAGTTAALDQLNKYFAISGMPQVPSQYWNMVHGAKAEDIKQDEEGMQILRSLGRNMAWLLRCIEAGKQAGISYPEREAQIRTNFVR